jgi:hypothetical protein
MGIWGAACIVLSAIAWFKLRGVSYGRGPDTAKGFWTAIFFGGVYSGAWYLLASRQAGAPDLQYAREFYSLMIGLSLAIAAVGLTIARLSRDQRHRRGLGWGLVVQGVVLVGLTLYLVSVLPLPALQ